MLLIGFIAQRLNAKVHYGSVSDGSVSESLSHTHLLRPDVTILIAAGPVAGLLSDSTLVSDADTQEHNYFDLSCIRAWSPGARPDPRSSTASWELGPGTGARLV